MKFKDVRLGLRVVADFGSESEVRGVVQAIISLIDAESLVVIRLDSQYEGYLFIMNGTYISQKKGYITHICVHPDNLTRESLLKNT